MIAIITIVYLNFTILISVIMYNYRAIVRKNGGKSMKRKSLALLLALSMIFTYPANVFAAGDDLDIIIEDEQEEISVETEEIQEEISVDSADSQEEIVIEDDGEEAGEAEVVDETEEDTNKRPPLTARIIERNIPVTNPEYVSEASYNDLYDADYYVTPNLPYLRDQGKWGSCWAHAAMAAAEINLIQKGWDSKSIDFSELQLSYFMYNTVSDPLGGTEGDSNTFNTIYMDTDSKEGGFLNVGGNNVLAANVLSTWTGAADEAAVPYSQAQNVLDNGLPATAAYTDVAHLSNYYIASLTSKPEDIAAVKRLIVDNGAAAIHYNANEIARDKDGNKISFYNSEYNSFYNPNKTPSNHVVTIVGWDDTFDKTHFNVEAPGNGAWRIRNSWYDEKFDTEDKSESYYGYFWISYYDQTLESLLTALDFEAADNYDHNYQYDGGCLDYGFEMDKAANVFTIHGGSETEVLKAVSFYTYNTDSKYLINIYKDLKDANDPESGTLVATKAGEIGFEGYYTAPLDEGVTLAKGTVFSVVLSFEPLNAEDTRTMFFSAEYTMDSSDIWINSITSAKEGQSFEYSQGKWADFGTKHNANLKIKAFTVDSSEPAPSEYTISYEPNGGTLDKEKIYPDKYKTGDEFSFEAPIPPTGYLFEGWYADEELKAAKSGIVKSDKRNVKVYARYIPIRYEISFDANGAKGEMKPVTATYDEDFTLPENGFTNEGKYFLEWNTKADGKGTAYKNGDTVLNLTEKDGDTVTLYAIWTDKAIAVTDVDIDLQSLELYINSSDNTYNVAEHLVFTGADGKDPTDKAVTWESSDPKVVTVDENGVVAVAKENKATSSQATITVTTKDGSKKDSVDVHVSYWIEDIRIFDTGKTPKWYGNSNEAEVEYLYGVPKEGELLEKSFISLEVGKTFNVKADFLPKIINGSNVTEAILNRNVVWTSDNSSVATIDDKGKITAISTGYAKISAIGKDDQAGRIIASCQMVVYEPATSITLSETSFTLGVNNTLQLEATVLPFTADQGVLWSVQQGKEGIVTVSEKGLVTAKSAGKATVYAKTSDGKKTAKCNIKVGQGYDKIIIKAAGDKNSVAVGKKLQLSAVFTDSKGNIVKPANDDVIWEASNGFSATLTSNGLLTGLFDGQVTVKAVSAIDNKIYAEKQFDVYVPVGKAVISDKTLTIAPGKSYTPTVTITPEVKKGSLITHATGSDVFKDVADQIVWGLENTSDSQYLTVDAKTGKITAIKDTAKAVNVQAKFRPYGAQKDTVLTCKVTVKKQDFTGFKLSATKLNAYVDSRETITAKFTPAIPEEDGIVWTLDDPDGCISMTQNGYSVKLTPKKATDKKIKLTATTVGKNSKGKTVTASCEITVSKAPGYVEIINAPKELYLGKSFNLKVKAYEDSEKKTELTWKGYRYISSDSNVLKVSSSGKVTAVGNGDAAILALAGNNAWPLNYATIKVVAPPKKITLDKKNVSVCLNSDGKGAEYAIVDAILDADDYSLSEGMDEVTWTVDDPSKIKWGAIKVEKEEPEKVAELLANGMFTLVDATDKGYQTHSGESLAIKGLSAGKLKLTATVKGKKKAVCTVTIRTYVNGLGIKETTGIKKVTANEYILDIKAKKNTTIKPMVSLYGAPYSDAKKTQEEKAATATYNKAKKFAPDMGVTYVSSDPSVVSVNSKGKVKALKSGTADIIVYTKDRTYKNVIHVEVK